jgi:hypothetical protein
MTKNKINLPPSLFPPFRGRGVGRGENKYKWNINLKNRE